MRLSLLVLVVALLFSSCSLFGGDDGAQETTTFRVGITRPASLDPMKARTVDEQMLADHLFDTLVTLDADTLEPQPGLASWTTSDDGLRWEFTLEEGPTFSNGDPVTAFDVEATFDRAVQRASGSAVADLLEPVAGWREVAVDGSATELAGVTAVSETVITIELASPWSSLPVALAQPGLGIVPRSEVGAVDFDQKPEGSGPFRVASATRTRLVLVPADGRATKVDRIDVALFDDQSKAYAAYVDGHLDWSPVPPDRAEEAATRYGRKYFRTYVAELFYAFNLRSPKWADKRARQAVVHAVNREAIIEEIYNSTLRPMTSFVVGGVPGGGEDACGDACAFDTERATALLAEVTGGGATPFPEIALDFEGDPTQTAVAEAIEEDLEAVGFTVTLRPKPLDEYERFAVSGDQDLFRLGWIAAYPDADGFLAPLFASGSANNLPGFALGTVDDLLRQARATSDAEARKALYQQVDRAVFAEVPVVPIGQFQQHWVATPRVRDLTLTVTGTFDASAVWLAAG